MAGPEGKLSKLTRAQERLAEAVRDEWIPIAHSTEPADRHAAEEGVRILYEAAGFATPKIRWVASPRAAFKREDLALEHALTGWRGTLGGTDQPETSLRRQFEEALEEKVEGLLVELVYQLVGDPVDAAFRSIVEKPVVAAAKLFVPVKRWASCHSHWIPVNKWETIGGVVIGLALAPTPGWVASAQFWQRAGVFDSETITGYSLVKRNSAWWWPTREEAILLERPAILKTDGEGRLHSRSGKAIEYRSGWGLHVNHGAVTENPTRRSWLYPCGGTLPRSTLRVSPVGGYRA